MASSIWGYLVLFNSSEAVGCREVTLKGTVFVPGKERRHQIKSAQCPTWEVRKSTAVEHTQRKEEERKGKQQGSLHKKRRKEKKQKIHVVKIKSI